MPFYNIFLAQAYLKCNLKKATTVLLTRKLFWSCTEQTFSWTVIENVQFIRLQSAPTS